MMCLDGLTPNKFSNLGACSFRTCSFYWLLLLDVWVRNICVSESVLFSHALGTIHWPWYRVRCTCSIIIETIGNRILMATSMMDFDHPPANTARESAIFHWSPLWEVSLSIVVTCSYTTAKQSIHPTWLALKCASKDSRSALFAMWCLICSFIVALP